MSTEHELSRRGRGIGETYRDACERLAGQLRAAETDLAQLTEQRDAVLALHRSTPGQFPPECQECRADEEFGVWPCATVQALGGVS